MEDMLDITPAIQLPLREIEFTAIRAQGAGGQKVNKTSSAAQLRFDSAASSLSDECKQRFSELRDSRIAADGVVVIKAQRFRSLEQNREDALQRLAELIRKAAFVPRTRRPTKPSRSSQRKRVDSKTQRGRVKVLRGRPTD